MQVPTFTAALSPLASPSHTTRWTLTLATALQLPPVAFAFNLGANGEPMPSYSLDMTGSGTSYTVIVGHLASSAQAGTPLTLELIAGSLISSAGTMTVPAILSVLVWGECFSYVL